MESKYLVFKNHEEAKWCFISRLLSVFFFYKALRNVLYPWDSPGKYWSGLPFPPSVDLQDTGIKLRSPALQADTLPSKPPGKLRKCFLGLCLLSSHVASCDLCFQNLADFHALLYFYSVEIFKGSLWKPGILTSTTNWFW